MISSVVFEQMNEGDHDYSNSRSNWVDPANENLVALPASPFDGYQESVSRISQKLLITFDRNRYSVEAMAVGKVISVWAYANRIIMVLDGKEVGSQCRHLGRDKVIYDPWHYLAVLERKPGALRDDTSFKQKRGRQSGPPAKLRCS